MSGKNEAKLATLEYAIELGEISSNDLAWVDEITLHAASIRLKRAYNQGLLDREREGRAYFYSITQKGIERLHWLQSVEEKNREELWKSYSRRRCRIIRDNETLEVIEIRSESDPFTDSEDLENYLLLLSKRRCRIKR